MWSDTRLSLNRVMSGPYDHEQVTMVDPNVLFMYSLAATKALVTRVSDTRSRILRAFQTSVNRNWSKKIDGQTDEKHTSHLPLPDLQAHREGLEISIASLREQVSDHRRIDSQTKTTCGKWCNGRICLFYNM